MVVSELIGMLRSRLRDEASEGWSDDELITAINFALSAIAHKLMPWKGRWVCETIMGVDTYSIPEDFMAPISLFVDGIPISIKGIEDALTSNTDDACAFIDNGELIFSSVPTQDGIGFYLNYHLLYQVKDLHNVLPIGDEYTSSVLYYALSVSLQKEAHEQSLTQSKYYLSLYDKQVGDMAYIASKRRSAVRVKSTFQKV